MDIPAYFERIDYQGPAEPALEMLRALHRAHLMAVPFENLDIHLGREIRLDEAAFYEKIVGRRRGGFCYELNGLFARLLEVLGFRVTRLSARVFGENGPGPEFDHLLLRVDLDLAGQGPDSWLADVGFGDNFIEPLRLEPDVTQSQTNGDFRLVRAEEDWDLQRSENGEWMPQYRFSLRPRALAEFAGMCVFQQTSPDSGFTRRRICSRATPEGRLTLSNDRWIVTENGERRERPVAGEAERLDLLQRHFGIVLERPVWRPPLTED